jgi:hypothetical protein
MPLLQSFVSPQSERAYTENMLNNYYRSGIVNGQSRSSLYDATIGTDLGIRKTDSLAISRAAQEQADTIMSFRDVPDGSPIQPSDMLEMNSPGKPAYMFVVKVDMLTLDGELINQDYLPMYYDQVVSKENILAAANDLKTTKGGTDVEVSAYEVTEAWLNTA